MSNKDKNDSHVSNNNTEEHISNVPGEFMTSVDEDYHRFQELINQNLAIENNLEKELAKEDKKCTFLRRKVEGIHKETSQLEKVNVELREYIYNQQMEIEQISSSIREQKTQLKIKFPDEGVSYYSSTVSVLLNMVDYIKYFKVMLLNIIEECNENDAEVKIRAEAVEKVLNRIQELQKEAAVMKNTAVRLKRMYLKYDFHSIQRNISLLTKKFDDYLEVKHNSAMHNSEICEFQKQLQECIDRNEQTKSSISRMSKNIDKFIGVYNNEYNVIKKIGIDIEGGYYALIKEWEFKINHIFEQIKILEEYILRKKEKLGELLSQGAIRNRETEEISSQLMNTENEYHNSVIQKNTIVEQENYSSKIKNAMEQQLNILENNEKESTLKLLMEENSLLRDKIDASTVENQKTALNICDLLEMIKNEENYVNTFETIDQQFEHDLSGLEEVAEELSNNRNEKKTELIMRQMERSSIEESIKNVKEKLDQEHAIRIAEINRRLNESRRNANKLSNSIIENKLFVDSLHNDAEYFNNQYTSMQCTIRSTNQEKEKLNDLLKQINDEISKKTTDCKSKQRLFQDLKKNSFPRTEIPKDWFKSFEKQKRDYEQFLKEKSVLEKRRNKLIIALDNGRFQGNRSGTLSENENSVKLPHSRSITPSMKENPKKIPSQEEGRDALFQVFKAKINDSKLLMEKTVN